MNVHFLLFTKYMYYFICVCVCVYSTEKSLRQSKLACLKNASSAERLNVEETVKNIVQQKTIILDIHVKLVCLCLIKLTQCIVYFLLLIHISRKVHHIASRHWSPAAIGLKLEMFNCGSLDLVKCFNMQVVKRPYFAA